MKKNWTPRTNRTIVRTGSGVCTKSAWCGQPANFINSASTAQRKEMMKVAKPAKPNMYSGLVGYDAMNLIVMRSKTTLIVRDKPYFDLPIVRAWCSTGISVTRAPDHDA